VRGRTVALVALGFVLACARAQALEWQYCEGAEDHEAEVDFVTMSPDPALAGGEITVHIGGTIERKILGGALHLTVFFHKVPVYKEEDDLCDRTNCPAQGNFEVLAKQKLPSFTLPGDYQLKISAEDPDKKELVCVMLDLQIKR